VRPASVRLFLTQLKGKIFYSPQTTGIKRHFLNIQATDSSALSNSTLPGIAAGLNFEHFNSAVRDSINVLR